jgi:opacity protein-like surface antigen
MKLAKFILLIIAAIVSGTSSVAAKDFNDKVLNRPYADLRRWHLGFSIGMFASDLLVTHNGFITEDGEEWRVEQPDYQPGFCVNGLFDLRLNNYFNLRFSPGMYFGSRDMQMRDIHSDATQRQNIKSTYVVLPFDLKFSALRYRNSRPYVLAGLMPAFDVAKRRSDYLKLKASDCYVSLGFGCDFYMPYFKFIPELKFCFGLSDLFVKDRPDLVEDPAKLNISQSVSKATSKMIVLTFYFE